MSSLDRLDVKGNYDLSVDMQIFLLYNTLPTCYNSTQCTKGVVSACSITLLPFDIVVESVTSEYVVPELPGFSWLCDFASLNGEGCQTIFDSKSAAKCGFCLESSF